MSFWKSFFDCPEEIFIGASLQFPLIFIVGWWVLPLMGVCGVLWRLGGMAGGSKLFRRLGVPIIACGASFMVLHDWWLFIAVPLMVWLCPASYGKSSWLYKLFLKITKENTKKADFLTRVVLYFWYWAVFSIALVLQ